MILRETVGRTNGGCGGAGRGGAAVLVHIVGKPLLLEGCALSSVQALRTPAAPEYGLRPDSFLVPRAGPHAEPPFPLAQSPCHQDFGCEGRDGSGAQWTAGGGGGWVGWADVSFSFGECRPPGLHKSIARIIVGGHLVWSGPIIPVPPATSSCDSSPKDCGTG